MPAEKQILFPPFRLDLVNECLWSGVESVPLTRKAYRVLLHLAQHAGRLVTKDELLDAVWPETHVGEGVLKVAVAEIRKALNDVSRPPGFIETAHRRGYRFIAEIQSGSSEHGIPAFRAVEREAALAQLEALARKAMDGDGHVVFITGETGIGKTTLVESFLSRASNEGAWQAHGQCLEHFAEGEAYFPVLEALGRLCREPGCERLVDILRQHAPTWLAQMPSLVTDADREALKRETLGAAKERMLREIAQAIETLTAETPLILVLEDLHWSDYSTVDLIGHLARRKGSARLLVIGTYRPAEVIVKQHPLREMKRELQAHRRCSELALEFLSQSAITRYLELRFPGNQFPEPLAQLIYESTDGNPLFLVNVVDYLISQGHLARRNNRWLLAVPLEEVGIGIPDSLQQLIERQIERLSEEEQRLLTLASVAGLEFSTRTLSGASDLGIPAIEACCDGLMKRRQFLRPAKMIQLSDGSLLERYGFVHGLHQHVLYHSVPPARRVLLHRRLGEFQEAAYAAHITEIAAELAVHFEEGRDYQKAVRYRRLSATNALTRHANGEAIRHLDKALAMLAQIPAGDRALLEGALLEERAAVRRAMDDNEGAAADLERVMACANEAGRPDWEVRALLKLSSVLFWTNHDRSLAVAGRAVDLSGNLSEPWLHAQAKGYRASRRIRLQGWSDDDFRDVVEAMEAARAAGDRAFLGLHTMSYSFFQSYRSHYEEACAAANAGLEIAVETNDSFLYVSCQYFKAWALLHSGRWGESLRLVRDGILVSEKNGHGTAATVLRMIQSRLHAQAFDFEEARELALQSLVRAREGFPRFITLIMLGEAHLGLGEHDRAADCFQEVIERSREGPYRLDWIFHLPLYRALSQLWMERGDFDRAREDALLLCRLAEQPGQRTYTGLARCLLTEIALAEGDLEEAARQVSLAQAATHDAQAPMAEWRVHAASARLAERRGQAEEAAACRAASAAVLQLLAGSMEEGEPLRASLLERAGRVSLAAKS